MLDKSSRPADGFSKRVASNVQVSYVDYCEILSSHGLNNMEIKLTSVPKHMFLI